MLDEGFAFDDFSLSDEAIFAAADSEADTAPEDNAEAAAAEAPAEAAANADQTASPDGQTAPAESADSAPQITAEQVNELRNQIEALNKRVADNQRWGNQKANEAAELKKQLEALQKAEPPKPLTDAEKEQQIAELIENPQKFAVEKLRDAFNDMLEAKVKPFRDAQEKAANEQTFNTAMANVVKSFGLDGQQDKIRNIIKETVTRRGEYADWGDMEEALTYSAHKLGYGQQPPTQSVIDAAVTQALEAFKKEMGVKESGKAGKTAAPTSNGAAEVTAEPMLEQTIADSIMNAGSGRLSW